MFHNSISGIHLLMKGCQMARTNHKDNFTDRQRERSLKEFLLLREVFIFAIKKQ